VPRPRVRGTDKGELRLYVTGSTLLSLRAIENLEWSLQQGLAEIYDCEVIDVLEHPEIAAEDGIFATPALVRRKPPPVRKLIGDLSDRELVLRSLRFGGGARDNQEARRGRR
jgi:circadian clock protein KaiB